MNIRIIKNIGLIFTAFLISGICGIFYQGHNENFEDSAFNLKMILNEGDTDFEKALNLVSILTKDKEIEQDSQGLLNDFLFEGYLQVAEQYLKKERNPINEKISIEFFEINIRKAQALKENADVWEMLTFSFNDLQKRLFKNKKDLAAYFYKKAKEKDNSLSDKKKFMQFVEKYRADAERLKKTLQQGERL